MQNSQEKIIEVAKAVREAQKAYLKDRTKENLIKSKQLEKELDELLKPPVKNLKKIILDRIDGLMSDFLYYDRKNDDELSMEQLNNSVASGEITVDEMVLEFQKYLEATFNKKGDA